MSEYRYYPPAGPLLIGYDPDRDLPANHLARMVDQVVDDTIHPGKRITGKGQPPYNPRLTLKVLLYGYCTGVRSSRQLERLCKESLPYLFLVRGDGPSYRTLCFTRARCKADIEQVWVGLLAIGQTLGLSRMGRITVDSTKLRANAGPEAVLRRNEYPAVRTELARILAEAADQDAREDADGSALQTVLEKHASREEMRDILRRVRAEQAEIKHRTEQDSEPSDGAQDAAAPTAALTPRMRKRIVEGIAAIDAAVQEDRKQPCLTDPDARMLCEGRSKQVRECHSFEVAVDNTLLVASGVTTTQDYGRLIPLVKSAQEREPEGVTSVVADSGYWRSDDIASLEASGIQTCIPDSFTARDLRRGLPVNTTRAKGRGSVAFTYDAEQNCYRCPEGNTLIFLHRSLKGAQMVQSYSAERECVNCPRAKQCLTQKNARRRYLSVGVDSERLSEVLERFKDPQWQSGYHGRAPAVETVFGFLRAVLGYGSWLLRGTERVSCEASLFTAAYQFRKIHAQTRHARGQPA